MATQAHCAYCFESLAADLEKRPGLSLYEVETLWTRYNNAEEADADTDDPATAALAYKPAAVTRLLASTPSSGSSSSSTPGSSTPSGMSANSSATSLSSEDKSVQEHPLFVTWNTLSSRGDQRLRGCIGTFSPHDLDDGLKSYAVTSALHDTRFSPVKLRELPSLSCAVTLLTDFEPAPDPYAWDLGKHGIRLSFTHHGRRYGATFLPNVAVEQGWTKEETLTSLMQKAGWRGKGDEWKKVDLHVVRYQGVKVALDYDEWKAWREWVDEQEK